MNAEEMDHQHHSDEPGGPNEKPSALDIARGMGVLLGPSLLLGLFVAAGTWAVATDRMPRQGPARLLRPFLVLGAAFPWAYALVIRPWHLRWGATDEEVEKPLPGDELVPEPVIESTRAITVHAPVEAVWPWLAQLGQDRGGFYSYEWLENLAGAWMRNALSIHPEWQHREVGRPCSCTPP
jgi:hypothetical protein